MIEEEIYEEERRKFEELLREEIESGNICPKCDTINVGRKTCSFCGIKLK